MLALLVNFHYFLFYSTMLLYVIRSPNSKNCLSKYSLTPILIKILIKRIYNEYVIWFLAPQEVTHLYFYFKVLYN